MEVIFNNRITWEEVKQSKSFFLRPLSPQALSNLHSMAGKRWTAVAVAGFVSGQVWEVERDRYDEFFFFSSIVRFVMMGFFDGVMDCTYAEPLRWWTRLDWTEQMLSAFVAVKIEKKMLSRHLLFFSSSFIFMI